MGKYVGNIYKHSQPQLSTTSIKEPAFHPEILKHNPLLN